MAQKLVLNGLIKARKLKIIYGISIALDYRYEGFVNN
jgi:hypothetical protein